MMDEGGRKSLCQKAYDVLMLRLQHTKGSRGAKTPTFSVREHEQGAERILSAGLVRIAVTEGA